MKKRLLRLSKRILILSLCTCLVSGSVINKYKITANATAAAAALTAFSAQEICMWLGMTILGASGVAAIVDNSDKIVELGKNFVDSMNVDEVSGWILTKVNTAGQSYVYGSEALKEIQDMSFEVIQGGGNMPENNEDNDDDGDIDADDRTVELRNLGLWATSSFANLLCEQVQPILDKVYAGEENIISESLGLEDFYFDKNISAFNPDDGYYHYHGGFSYVSNNISFNYVVDGSKAYSSPIAGYYTEANKVWFLTYSSSGFSSRSIRFSLVRSDSSSVSTVSEPAIGAPNDLALSVGVSLPVFSTKADAEAYLRDGIIENCTNESKVYQIADWLQEEWTSALKQLNTGIRSLNDNMLIVGEAMNQALQNQLDGLGYISAIDEGVSGAVPMSLPDTIADPIYYPGDSSTPELEPEKLPWYVPTTAPGTDSGDNGSDEGSTSEEDIRGTDSFGLDTLFGILILLIMILIMLLTIFLSCLAFIIMIFRIEPTTGFLPGEMIAGLEYLKTLQIPGFGMSVYGFFMALIYIILIFTVIGILRKNIDKIKFPRKGRW